MVHVLNPYPALGSPSRFNLKLNFICNDSNLYKIDSIKLFQTMPLKEPIYVKSLVLVQNKP